MVFESIVAEILNRFLGDYVENLDRSQLKIGIWGGKSNMRVVFFGVDVFKCSVQQCVEKRKVTKLYSLSLSWPMHTFSLFNVFSYPVAVLLFMCVLNLAGDVVLQDLVLKQSALDDLDLPVKTIFGTLGTQSLYNLCIKLMNVYFILKYPLYCTTYHPY